MVKLSTEDVFLGRGTPRIDEIIVYVDNNHTVMILSTGI